MTRTIGKILTGACVAAVAIMGLLFVVGPFGPTQLQGSHVLTVLSGSMEPLLHVGAVAIVREVDPASAKVGDVVTFKTPAGVGRAAEDALTTHRIVEVCDRGGRLVFRTKGDANRTMDQWEVPAADLVGTLVFSVPGLGYAAAFARTRVGLLLMVVLPGVLLIFAEVRSIARELRDKSAGVPSGELRTP